MKIKFIANLFIVLFPLLSFSQNEMTKVEIYSFVSYIDENRELIKTSFDTTVVDFIDSLKVERIDTIGIFSYSSHRSFLSDSKDKCRSNWTAYVHWIKNGKTKHQKIEQICNYESQLIENSDFISFYIREKSLIDNQKIMPVILSASLNKDGIFKTSSQTTTSSTDYVIYCELNGHSTMKTFDSDEMNNKENIFYKENNKSQINKWLKIIRKQIDKLEKN